MKSSKMFSKMAFIVLQCICIIKLFVYFLKVSIFRALSQKYPLQQHLQAPNVSLFWRAFQGVCSFFFCLIYNILCLKIWWKCTFFLAVHSIFFVIKREIQNLLVKIVTLIRQQTERRILAFSSILETYVN